MAIVTMEDDSYAIYSQMVPVPPWP